ncbi:uncharacterized protein [Leuresthes tenuis]|uniref:uncharacterized protein n=1 Tax=Leuresthes tenuis TaxID=355514 RepID=UPI003B50596D
MLPPTGKKHRTPPHPKKTTTCGYIGSPRATSQAPGPAPNHPHYGVPRATQTPQAQAGLPPWGARQHPDTMAQGQHHHPCQSGPATWLRASGHHPRPQAPGPRPHSESAENLGVMIDDQLTFKDHVTSVARSCRFALLNIRKIRPYLTQHATQLLVQAMVISRLDYCNALLTGLPACAGKPLQMIQNAAARLFFDQPKRAHVTPLFIELHWLPLAARIKFKSLMLAYKVLNGTALIYLNALAKAYVTTRSLRSSQDCRLAAPTPRLRQSKLFSCVIPRWWNDLLSATRTGASLSIFKKLLKTQLFREHLLS